jgi:hypothetical protein
MAMNSTFKLADDDLHRVQKVIKAILKYSGHDELYETRIQKILFLGEVYCVLWYRRRLTQVEYCPYMYGAFSRDLRTALNDIQGVSRQKTVVHGNRTVAYTAKEEPEDMADSVQEIVEHICNHSSSQSTEDLAQFSKDSWLFTNTDYNHPMKFAEFAEALDENPNIEENLKTQMPSCIDSIDRNQTLLPIAGYTGDNN